MQLEQGHRTNVRETFKCLHNTCKFFEIKRTQTVLSSRPKHFTLKDSLIPSNSSLNQETSLCKDNLLTLEISDELLSGFCGLWFTPEVVMWLGKVPSTPAQRPQGWHGANPCRCQVHITQSIACPNSFILHSQLSSSPNQSRRVPCGVVLSHHRDLSPKKGLKGARNPLNSYFPRYAEEAQSDAADPG